MTQPQIKRNYSEPFSIEASSELLKEMLNNFQQVQGYLNNIKEEKSDYQKEYILDLLGSEKDIYSAKTTIEESVILIVQEIGELQLSQMGKRQLLSQTDLQLIKVIERSMELERLNNKKDNNLQR